MTSPTLQLSLIGLLAAALAYAAVIDWRERLIHNWLNLAIACGAPLFWLASGYSLWPDMGVQILLALGVTIFFAIFFFLGAMGGGDVKLLGALALWIAPLPFASLILTMSIIGGGLTLFMLIRQRVMKALGKPEIPYGIAISLAGLWSIYERYLNHFA
jgi:prepilin peptidase CpaA